MAHRTHIVVPRSAIREFEVHQFVADASELGFAPGEWPKTLTVDAPIGNGRLFELVRAGQDACAYRQSLGCISIIVHND